jgi:hypothetical protein
MLDFPDRRLDGVGQVESDFVNEVHRRCLQVELERRYVEHQLVTTVLLG